MAKAPQQIIANHKQHAERSKNAIENAKVTSNPALAAFNTQQGFKACLMQGLIGWRCGILSPVDPFKDALGVVRNGVSILSGMHSENATTNDLPLEKTSFLAFLVKESHFAFDLSNLLADRLLDAVLGFGLQDKWDEEKWTVGVNKLRDIKGSALACESYMTYYHLLRFSQESNTKATVERAISLFEKRKSNSFYGGGDQTDGGGNDNSVTVDYRLSAILKKIGFKSDSVHSWQWG